LVVQQLSVSFSTTQPQAPRFNPRPPGQIQDGSGTHAILEYMRTHPDKWMTRNQIIIGTGRSGKSVDWGISFLVQQKLIRRVQDGSRNPRWNRYRYVGKEK
jgi:hypothetical protein